MKFKLIILVLFALLFGFPIAYWTSSETITITVEKTSTKKSDETEKYLVTTSEEVFENTDSWLYLKFDSSDFDRKLKKGQTYNVKVAGWRWPILSSYRNIVSIEE